MKLIALFILYISLISVAQAQPLISPDDTQAAARKVSELRKTALQDSVSPAHHKLQKFVQLGLWEEAVQLLGKIQKWTPEIQYEKAYFAYTQP